MGEREEREAARLLDEYVSARMAGRQVDIEKVVQRCPVSERESLRSAIAGTSFVADNAESVLAPPEVVQRVSEQVATAMARWESARLAQERLDAERHAGSLTAEGVVSLLQRVLGLLPTGSPVPPAPAMAMYRGGPALSGSTTHSDVFLAQAAEHARRLWFRMGCPDLPIDPKMAAEQVGLVVVERDLEGCDGCVVMDGQRGGIAINRAVTNSDRRRFTLAHEIGHFELHRSHARFFTESLRDIECGPQRQEEAEASAFASELLLPTTVVRPQFAHEAPSFWAIERLADQGQVSLTAAARRFVRMSDFACALICTVDGTMRWFERSEVFPYRVQMGTEPPAHSDAAALARGEVSQDRDWATDASWWCPDDGRAEGREVSEHSRYVYSDHILTLLYARDVEG